MIADTTFVTATTDRFRAVVQPFEARPSKYKPRSHRLMTDGSSLASENITTSTAPGRRRQPVPPRSRRRPASTSRSATSAGTRRAHSEDDKRGSIDCSTDDNDVETDDVCLEDETGTQKLIVKTLRVNY